MQRTAKIFMISRSQAVRLPKEFQFKTFEVFIRKQGDEVILSPGPSDWSAFLASDKIASDEFMQGVDDPPPQDSCYQVSARNALTPAPSSAVSSSLGRISRE